MDEAVVEEPQSDQNHSYAPEVVSQSILDHVDQEQEVVEELLDLDLEDKPSRQHKQVTNYVSTHTAFFF